MEIIVLSTAGKENRVFGKSFRSGFSPTSTRERLINSVVIKLRPEEFLEWVNPREVFKELFN